MENIINKKQFPSIDIMKFIMAILVINIHKPFVSDSVPYVNLISQTAIGGCAVPFFFMCSAFFLFRKFTDNYKQNKSIFLSFLKRLFILYLLWSAIYLPCIFVKSFTGHYDEITIKSLIGQSVVWVKDFIFSQSFTHFWYMNTLMLSAIFVFILLKKLSSKTVLIISFSTFFIFNALYILNILYDSFIIPNLYTTYFPVVLKNTLQIGMLCVSLGAYFAMEKPKVSFKSSAVFSAFFIIISVIVNIIVNRYGDVTIPLTRLICILAAYFIFSMCALSNIKDKPIYPKLRSYSSLMYFSHLLLMSEGLNYLARVTKIEAFSTSYPLAFFLSVFLSLALAIIVTSLQKKKHLSWLKYLY